VALNSAVGGSVDPGGWSHGLGLPAKKPGKEIGSLATIAASDLEVNYGQTHVDLLAVKNGRHHNMAAAKRCQCEVNVRSPLTGRPQSG
jgi:hypothetical protein